MPKHLTNVLQKSFHLGRFAWRIQPKVAHHLELFRRDVTDDAVNEFQHRPRLFVANPIMIFIEKRHSCPRVGHDAGILDSWMANIASNVAPDSLPILNPRVGMDGESIPISAN